MGRSMDLIKHFLGGRGRIGREILNAFIFLHVENFANNLYPCLYLVIMDWILFAFLQEQKERGSSSLAVPFAIDSF